jgi:hypothetical protein
VFTVPAPATAPPKDEEEGLVSLPADEDRSGGDRMVPLAKPSKRVEEDEDDSAGYSWSIDAGLAGFRIPEVRMP